MDRGVHLPHGSAAGAGRTSRRTRQRRRPSNGGACPGRPSRRAAAAVGRRHRRRTGRGGDRTPARRAQPAPQPALHRRHAARPSPRSRRRRLGDARPEDRRVRARRDARRVRRCSRRTATSPKVTIFGSARTRPDDPVYVQARDVAHAPRRARLDGRHRCRPGHHAGGDGGRRPRAVSIGVSIRLPFEQAANPVIAGDEKYVSMKYFFTRKLMLVKESRAFVCLPGGFGTLDETFELLTLTQTGKGVPGADRVPRHARRPVLGARRTTFVARPAGHPRAGQRRPTSDLYLVTDYVRRGGRRDRPLLRQLRLAPLRRRPARDPAAPRARPTSSWRLLNERFAAIVASGHIERSDATADRGPRGRPRSTSRGSASRSPGTATATCGPDRPRQRLRAIDLAG